MMDVSAAAGLVGGGTAISLGLAWVGRTLIRRFARDGVEYAKDRAEVEILNERREENRQLRADLKEATEKNNASMRELGRLTATVEALTDRLDRGREESIRNALEIKEAVKRAESRTLIHQAQVRAAQGIISEQVRETAQKVDLNTELTRLTRDDAKAAYEISNHVNDKLAVIGVAIRDGSPLTPTAAQAAAHQIEKNGLKPRDE